MCSLGSGKHRTPYGDWVIHVPGLGLREHSKPPRGARRKRVLRIAISSGGRSRRLSRPSHALGQLIRPQHRAPGAAHALESITSCARAGAQGTLKTAPGGEAQEGLTHSHLVRAAPVAGPAGCPAPPTLWASLYGRKIEHPVPLTPWRAQNGFEAGAHLLTLGGGWEGRRITPSPCGGRAGPIRDRIRSRHAVARSAARERTSGRANPRPRALHSGSL